MPNRAWVRQPRGPLRPFTLGSRLASSSTMTSSRTSSEVVEARRLHLPFISGALKPGVPFSTRKPRMPPSVWAQTTATSATVPLVIHIFVPLMRHLPPGSRTALVSMPPGLEPKSGSVRPKQPMASPVASLGSQRRFWASLP